MPGTLRLFVAIELPQTVRDALAEAVRVLRAAGADRGLRYVRPEGIHLTLKFLGAVQEERVPAISTALRLAVRDAAPFDVQPEGLGAFHGGKMRHLQSQQRESYTYNLRVLWVGLRESDSTAVSALAERVERGLGPLGFPAEARSFFPHLTLARTREDADRETREAIGKALAPFIARSTRRADHEPSIVPAFPAFRAEHVSLMRSTLAPGGATYDALASFPLEGAP